MQKTYKKLKNKCENDCYLQTYERQKEKETGVFSLKSEVSILKQDNTALKLIVGDDFFFIGFRAI